MADIWKGEINGEHALDMLAEAVHWYFEEIYDGPGGDPSWVHEGRDLIASALVPGSKDARTRLDAVDALFAQWTREERERNSTDLEPTPEEVAEMVDIVRAIDWRRS